MRLTSKLAGLAGLAAGSVLAGSMLAGAALAQALEVIGKPIPGGIGFQPAATELARDMQWLDHMILIIITAITGLVVLLMAVASWTAGARQEGHRQAGGPHHRDRRRPRLRRPGAGAP